jgi:hypothetical protein
MTLLHGQVAAKFRELGSKQWANMVMKAQLHPEHFLQTNEFALPNGIACVKGPFEHGSSNIAFNKNPSCVGDTEFYGMVYYW